MGNRDPLIESLGDGVARELARAGSLVRFATGEHMVREGEEGDTLFVILSGRVRVYVAGEDGREMVLGQYGSGSIVGEMFLDGKPRSASVKAGEPVTASELGRAGLLETLSARPEVALGIILRLIDRLRGATLNVKNLALLDVYGRVARLIMSLETEERDGRRISVESLTQKEIASRVGASRDMVALILKDLETGGYIAREGRRIVILRRPPARW